jgi:hypothetical protein
VQIFEGVGKALGVAVGQELAHTQLNASRIAQAFALLAAFLQVVGQLVLLLVGGNQTGNLLVGHGVYLGH